MCECRTAVVPKQAEARICDIHLVASSWAADQRFMRCADQIEIFRVKTPEDVVSAESYIIGEMIRIAEILSNNAAMESRRECFREDASGVTHSDRRTDV